MTKSSLTSNVITILREKLSVFLEYGNVNVYLSTRLIAGKT